MVKVIYGGLLKEDSPLISKPAFFGTPILLKNLDKLEKPQKEEASKATQTCPDEGWISFINH